MGEANVRPPQHPSEVPPSPPLPDPSTARGCSHPVRLRSTGVNRATGELLGGADAIYLPCGSRKASRCAACAAVYNADAFHLVRMGLLGPRTSGALPLFVTLTAPGASVFGSSHHFRSRSGTAACACGARHAPDDRLLGAPLDPEAFRYDRAVAWNGAVPELWRRFTVNLRRAFPNHDIEYARVVEFQRRGLVHVHAVIRVQVRDEAGARPLVTLKTARARVRAAARGVQVTPDGMDIPATWGSKIDVRPIVTKRPTRRSGESEAKYAARCRRSADGQGAASYIAKYATKTPEEVLAGVTGPLRSHLDALYALAWSSARPKWAAKANVTELLEGRNPTGDEWSYKVRMGRAKSEAAAYGFGGQVLTKSRDYSTTFRALRQQRREWALARLQELGITPTPWVWAVEGFGLLPAHADDGAAVGQHGAHAPPLS